MNHAPQMLRRLAPPAGGWQRLLARREAARRDVQPWLPLLAGGVSALLLLVLLTPQYKLDLSGSGARLVGASSTGVPVLSLDQRRVTPLATSEDGVKIYWMEAAPAAK